MTPGLILVDGFAGSGKSTAAQRLWLHLVRSGREAVWFHEHEAAHPIFEYGEVEELLRLDLDAFEEQIAGAWQAAADIAGPPAVRIVEGAFFQIPIAVMVAMNAPAARVRAMILRLDASLAGAGASLVYLSQPDTAAALARVESRRGREWIDAIVGVLSQSPYGRRHNVRSLAGLIRYYDRQRAIVDAVLPRLAVRRLAIDVSGESWKRYDRQMTSFLGIRPMPEKAPRVADLMRHVGAYRGAATGLPCVITTDGESLYAQLPSTRALRLVRVDGLRFAVESLPIDIRFTYDKAGRARRFAYESRMVNEVLADTSWVRT